VVFGEGEESVPMMKLLPQPILSERTARRFAWTASFVILTTCSALVLKALHEFGVGASVGLVSAIALAWVVLGTQLPKMVPDVQSTAPERPRE
jgi:hypothetical protein